MSKISIGWSEGRLSICLLFFVLLVILAPKSFSGDIASFFDNSDMVQPSDCPPSPGATGPNGPTPPSGDPHRGNPINVIAGNKTHTEIVYKGYGEFPLEYSLYYNSHHQINGKYTGRWSASYSQRLEFDADEFDAGTSLTILLYREQGQVIEFVTDKNSMLQAGYTLSNNPYDQSGRLEYDPGSAIGNFKYLREDGFIEYYNYLGQLKRIESPTGLFHTVEHLNQEIISFTEYYRGPQLCEAGYLHREGCQTWQGANGVGTGGSGNPSIVINPGSGGGSCQEEFICTTAGPNYLNWECKRGGWDSGNYECRIFAHRDAECTRLEYPYDCNFCGFDPICTRYESIREGEPRKRINETVRVSDNYGNSIAWDTSYIKGQERNCEGCTDIFTFQDDQEIAFTKKNGVIHTINSPLTGGTKTFLYELSDSSFSGGCYQNWLCNTALTGIEDEEGVRFATWEYTQLGNVPRAFVSYHGTGDEANDYIMVDYVNHSERIVTSDNGRSQRLTFEYVNDSIRLIKVVGQGGTNCKDSSFDYVYENEKLKTIYQNQNTEDEVRYDYTYDALGRVESITLGKGTNVESKAVYFWQGSHYSRVDYIDLYYQNSKYRTVDYVYYPNNRIKSVTETDQRPLGAPYFTTGQTRAVDYIYDYWDGAKTKLKSVIVDGPREDLLDQTEYSYSSQGFLTSVVNPMGHSFEFTGHNIFGNPAFITDERGDTYELVYQNQGSRIDKILTGGGYQLIDLEFYKSGEIKSVMLPNGEEYTYEYTSAKELKKITDGLDNWFSSERSVAPTGAGVDMIRNTIVGFHQTTILGNGTATSSQSIETLYDSRIYVDALDRVYKSFNEDIPNYEYTYEYTRFDALKSIENSSFKEKEFVFDPAKRRSEVKFDDQSSVFFRYDMNDVLKLAYDSRSASHIFGNDGFGQRVLSAAEGQFNVQKYDSAGNLVQVVGQLAGQDNYVIEYDALNRISNINYLNDSNENVILSWDDINPGELYSASNGESDTYFTRLKVSGGFVTEKKINYQVPGFNRVIKYNENEAGKLTSIVYPSGRTIKFEGYDTSNFNPNAKPTKIVVRSTIGGAPLNLINNVKYLPFGLPYEWDLYNGIKTVVEHGFDYQIDKITEGNRIVEYDRNDRGLISEETDSSEDKKFTYTYDSRGGLRYQNRFYNDVFDSFRAFVFDTSGNLTTYINSETGNRYDTEVAPVSNKISNMPLAGIGYIGYDQIGRTNLYTDYESGSERISQANKIFNYNESGRLESISMPKSGSSVEFAYNAFGERISKTRTVSGQSTTTHYLYGLDGELLAEFDDGGAVLREYVYWEGRLVFVIDGASGTGNYGHGWIYFVHSNHLGAPTQLTDFVGDVVWKSEYEPFGQIEEFTDPDGDGDHVELNVRFPGQYEDEETGLFYNYFRYYDPQLGRYITPDPIGLAGGMNSYLYANGNPIMYFDPFGLDVWVEGPSGGEPIGHQSVNVGDPFGQYQSFSFGLDSNFGSVYIDQELGGEIQRYMKSTPMQDGLALSEIWRTYSEDNKRWYGPDTCRTYSQDKFDDIQKLLGLDESKPPFRNPAEQSWPRAVSAPISAPISSTTSSTNAGPFR